MFGIDPRAARAAWTVFLLALTLVTIYWIRRTLLIFVIALLAAYLLGPVVGLLERVLERKLSRNASLTLVFIVLIAVIGAGVTAIASKVAEEAVQLGKTLPSHLQNPRLAEEFPLPDALKPYRANIVDFIKQQWESRSEEIVAMLTQAGREILGALGNVIFVVLIPILSFFVLKDGPSMRGMILEQFEAGRRAMIDDLMSDIHVLLVQFMRALVLISMATFIIFSVTLSLLGVPYAVLLAALGALGEFVPVAGPLVTGISTLIVAGVAGYPHLSWLAVFLPAYRLFLDYVLQPYLMGRGVALPPLAILFGVLAGEQIGGIPGMFLSIPALATLRVIYVRYRKARVRAA